MADDNQKQEPANLVTIIRYLLHRDAVAKLLNDGYYSVKEPKAATEADLLAVGIKRGVAGALLKHGTRCATIQLTLALQWTCHDTILHILIVLSVILPC